MQCHDFIGLIYESRTLEKVETAAPRKVIREDNEVFCVGFFGSQTIPVLRENSEFLRLGQIVAPADVEHRCHRLCDQ